MKYVPWVIALVLSVVAGISVKKCWDARDEVSKSAEALRVEIAKGHAFDSTMVRRKEESDSILASAKKLHARALDSLHLARKLTREADSSLAILQSKDEPTGSDSARAEEWKSRYTDAMKAAAKLKIGNTELENSLKDMTSAYSDAANAAYKNGQQRDDALARINSLEIKGAKLLEDRNNARCVLTWPVRVCPPPEVVFVTGAVVGGGIALIANRGHSGAK